MTEPVDVVVGPICDVVTDVPTAECEALMSIYENTGGGNWENTLAEDNIWGTSIVVDDWYAVDVADGHVAGRGRRVADVDRAVHRRQRVDEPPRQPLDLDAVADRLGDGADDGRRIGEPRGEAHPGRLGGEIDAAFHARQSTHHLLDPRRARRAPPGRRGRDHFPGPRRLQRARDPRVPRHGRGRQDRADLPPPQLHSFFPIFGLFLLWPV